MIGELGSFAILIVEQHRFLSDYPLVISALRIPENSRNETNASLKLDAESKTGGRKRGIPFLAGQMETCPTFIRKFSLVGRKWETILPAAKLRHLKLG